MSWVRGAQGRVVLARVDRTGEPVAIKYLARERAGDTRARTRFRSEAELLSRLADPHVTRLRDFVETAEGIAIVMEAVSGSSLRVVLDERVQLAPQAALATLKGSLLGLAAAHSVGVVHRDFKPANLVVQEDGQSKLIDFGVAVLTGQSSVQGTPAYMAPEQWRGEPSSPATDIYAATCVFFECVTSGRPYQGESIQTLMAQHLNAPVPVEGVPDPLRPLVASGMAKDPGQRLWDATAFVAELESIAASAYGRDWERQGVLALGSAVGLLAAAAPLGLLGSALVAPSTSAGAAAGGLVSQAPSFIAQPVVEAAGKGLLAKVGGAKGAAGIGGVATSAILTALFLWPSGPGVGGTSAGGYQAYFTRPGAVLANASVPDGDTSASPLNSWKLTVAPARAKPGTTVRMTSKVHGRTPWGLEYLGPGRFRCHEPNSERADAYHRSYEFSVGDRDSSQEEVKTRSWLYRIPPAKIGVLPTGAGIAAETTEHRSGAAKGYDTAQCAWTFDYTLTGEFTIPRDGSIRPGRYLVSPANPVGITQVKATVNGKLTSVPPVSVGARTEGTLPILTILKG